MVANALVVGIPCNLTWWHCTEQMVASGTGTLHTGGQEPKTRPPTTTSRPPTVTRSCPVCLFFFVFFLRPVPTRFQKFSQPDAFSDDSVTLSHVPSCLVCAASGSFCTQQSCPSGPPHRLCAQPFSICDVPRLLRTLSIFCRLSPLSALMCIHHVRVPADECMIFTAFHSMASSLGVPCCRQRIHSECFFLFFFFF